MVTEEQTKLVALARELLEGMYHWGDQQRWKWGSLFCSPWWEIFNLVFFKWCKCDVPRLSEDSQHQKPNMYTGAPVPNLNGLRLGTAYLPSEEKRKLQKLLAEEVRTRLISVLVGGDICVLRNLTASIRWWRYSCLMVPTKGEQSVLFFAFFPDWRGKSSSPSLQIYENTTVAQLSTQFATKSHLDRFKKSFQLREVTPSAGEFSPFCFVDCTWPLPKFADRALRGDEKVYQITQGIYPIP